MQLIPFKTMAFPPFSSKLLKLFSFSISLLAVFISSLKCFIYISKLYTYNIK